ncbi:phosphomannomutase [Paxillus involutus ATCC 200175]|nr:phosphomannomutase [Paxillus involutus ATCC 200175]
MSVSTSLEHLVKEWLRLDSNGETRREVEGLWDRQDIDELEKRMRTRIEFGTAGLRGRMEAGWARMNDLIIIQTSQGLCAYVLKHVANAASRGIVIGHDHRHNSKEWARLTAAVFASYNVRVYSLRGLVHTPLVPFSMKRLNAACGVMVTASHNPKDDNGFKAYWENAVQIINPHDTGIAQAILDNLEPRINDNFDVYASPLCLDRTDEMKESYFALIDAMANPKSRVALSPVKFVNTSMHGVSDVFASEVFRRANFEPYIAVEEQRVPDPDFPTVPFPNPEEKGALERAILTAMQSGADYVLAQDPDADRFSAAERGTDKGFTVFTGDQLGSLFASCVLNTYKASGKPLDKLAMVASTVSSKMIEAMARSEGFKFVDCLTGFKFIGNTALELERAGYEVPFGYEEAIGFMFGSEIRDKDGIAATLMFAELATELRRQGLTVREYLTGLYQKYGYFETRNSYFICSDPVKVDRIFAGLRSLERASHPSTRQYPASIAELAVTSVVDLTANHGYDSNNAPTYVPRLPLSSGHMIQFRAQSAEVSIVLTIRTSGTEPKIKYYLEGSGSDPQKVSAILPRVVDHLANEWMPGL